MTKAQLRAAARARRATCNPEWGIRLAGHILATKLIPPAAIVAGFWPMPGEIDIRPLLLALLSRGHTVLLPETPPRGNPLTFRQWRPGTRMVPERFGTLRPDAPRATPGVLLVPLLAFDAGCNRLGYGGGYYDRTIPTLPCVITVGCAFAAQQVDEIPVLPHDAPLDAVATERGVILNPER
jgi:5-formyltetrahydrofolate cyclo-ligase